MSAPPCTAIVRASRNPIPGRVDMNKLRLAIDLVNVATELTLYDVHTVTLDKDGSLALASYDRIKALLAHYGVINARIHWNPKIRTVSIS